MPTDQNILLGLLEKGSYAVILFFMLFVAVKVLWKQWKESIEKSQKDQKDFTDKIISIIETSAKNTASIEENNKLQTENNKLLIEILAQQDNYNNQQTIALNEISNQLNNNGNGKGGLKPSRKHKNLN